MEDKGVGSQDFLIAGQISQGAWQRSESIPLPTTHTLASSLSPCTFPELLVRLLGKTVHEMWEEVRNWPRLEKTCEPKPDLSPHPGAPIAGRTLHTELLQEPGDSEPFPGHWRSWDGRAAELGVAGTGWRNLRGPGALPQPGVSRQRHR